jgi:hypothetical protein
MHTHININCCKCYLSRMCCETCYYLQVYFVKVALLSLNKHRLIIRQKDRQLLKRAYVETVIEDHVRKTSIFVLCITSLVLIT